MFQRMFLMLGACAFMVPSLVTAADLPAPNPVVENAKRYDTNLREGSYIGVYGGYSWNDAEVSFPLIFPGVTRVVSTSFDYNKGRIGSFAGYNWIFAPSLLVGIEADVVKDWAGFESNGLKFQNGMNWSARGRLGYTLDRALVFVSGGYTGMSADFTGAQNKDMTFHGWTLGAGLDVAFKKSIFGRVEYRYNDYQDSTVNFGSTPITSDPSQSLINIGIGVKF
nr:outer membrane beta-barrel protein [uncultured Cohaesibacter sp.]